MGLQRFDHLVRQLVSGMEHVARISPEEYCEAAKELLENELHDRKYLASQLRGEEPIDGLSIEYALREIGKVLKMPNPDHYAGCATTIGHTLDEKSKQLVYGWLEDFLLNRPRRSIWNRAYGRAQRKKDRERTQRATPTSEAR